LDEFFASIPWWNLKPNPGLIAEQPQETMQVWIARAPSFFAGPVP